MIGLDLIAGHLLGDFIFQTDHQAKYKLKDWKVRAIHVCTYTIAITPFAIPYAASLLHLLIFLGLLWVIHFITDSRRWASGDGWPALPIVVDQSLHIIQLALLSKVLIGDLWFL